MLRQYTLSIKYSRIILLFITGFLLAGSSLHAQWQCDKEVYYSVWPYSNYPCGPGPITLRAEMIYCEPGISSGEYHWYATETSTDVLALSPYNGPGSTSDYTFDAYEGKQIWVCVYDYFTGCETRREPYTVSYAQPPSASIQYARVCNGTAQIQAALTGQNAYLYLYKQIGEYNYEPVQYSSDNFYQIDNYNPEDIYVVVIVAYNGACGGGVFIPVNFDVFDPTPPVIQGNTSVCEGQTGQLQADQLAKSKSAVPVRFQ